MFQFWDCTLFCLDHYQYYQPVYHQHSPFTQNWQFKKTQALFVYTGANTYVQKYTELEHILVYTKDPPLSVLNYEDNQHHATVLSCSLTKKVAKYQTGLQSIYHRQIPGASVRLKESISSYFEAYTKAHNCIYMKKLWIIIIVIIIFSTQKRYCIN